MNTFTDKKGNASNLTLC